jgi:hypothetical protein
MMSKERELLNKAIEMSDDACNWNLTVAALKDYDHVYVNGVRYVEYQPDINTQYLLDQVARLTAENAMLKEKWLAQPETEKEPVAWTNDSGGCFLSDGNKYSENWISLYTAPQNRKPLSEKEIREGNQSMLNATRETFIAGVRFAEVMHGITGGGE